jgi:hypothetical protein
MLTVLLVRFQYVFWLDATNTVTLEKGYKEMAAVIEGSDAAQISSDTARGALATLNTEWLLLMEGADDTEAMIGLWPPGRYGNILYTSRNLVLKDLASDAVCEVAVIENDEAVQLLLNAACLGPASDNVTQLAKDFVTNLGYLALAIDQAGAYIARGECQIYDFLATFERHHTSLLSVDAYHSMSLYQ